MYGLLIVDDEKPVVRGVMSSVEWEKHSISSVYSAYNIRQAKEIFDTYSIDIMICDIEMPQGNGLELLSWVVEHYPSTITIFLTCHADFKYARQAVQLGVLEYLLKPVRPSEMEAVIRRAIGKIEKERNLIAASETYRYYYQLWSMHQPLLIERFWLDILDRTIPLDSDAIRKILFSYDIRYAEDMQFVPILISIQRWHKKMILQDEKITIGEMQNVAEKLFVDGDKLGRVIPLKRNAVLVISPSDIADVRNKIQLRKKCQEYVDLCNKDFQCYLSCYIGIPAFIHMLPDILDELIKMDTDNVVWNNKVFYLNEKVKAREPIKLPLMNGWPEMFIQGEREKLHGELESSLKDLAMAEGLDAAAILEFYQDFMQIVYYVLKQKGLLAHQIFTRDELNEKEKLSMRSVTDLREWTKDVVDKVFDFLRASAQAQSLVEKVKLYITEHMTKELSREDIARHFFLSSDYLSRIFKKVTGLPVSEYLAQERLNIAKDLLVNTNMPISEIVSFIGYSSFSHFSKSFKKATNQNPLNFRKMKQLS